MKKRFLSILLVISLLSSYAITAFAQDSQPEIIPEDAEFEEVTGQIITMYDYSAYKNFDVLVICFDGKYSVKGEVPTVTLDTYTDGSKDYPNKKTGIQENLITQELFIYEGENYPQIFITVPIDFQYKDGRTFITIQEGVYLTGDGEKSKKVEICYTALEEDAKRDRIKISCTGDAVTRIDIKPVQVLQNSTVRAEGTFGGIYADVWMAESEIKFYHMDAEVEASENTVVTEGIGRYKAEFRLNDQLKISKNFQSVDKNVRYTENLKEKAEALLLSPIGLIVGIGMFIFVPGFGTWIGSTTLLACVYSIPTFFAALFGISLSNEYTF